METNKLQIRDFKLPTRCSSKSSLFWVVRQRWLVVITEVSRKCIGRFLCLTFEDAILLVLDAYSTETSNVFVELRTKRKRAQNEVMLHLA